MYGDLEKVKKLMREGKWAEAHIEIEKLNDRDTLEHIKWLIQQRRYKEAIRQLQRYIDRLTQPN